MEKVREEVDLSDIAVKVYFDGYAEALLRAAGADEKVFAEIAEVFVEFPRNGESVDIVYEPHYVHGIPLIAFRDWDSGVIEITYAPIGYALCIPDAEVALQVIRSALNL